MLVGHLGDFQSSNLEVERGAKATFHAQFAEAIWTSKLWAAQVAARMTPLGELSEVDGAHVLRR